MTGFPRACPLSPYYGNQVVLRTWTLVGESLRTLAQAANGQTGHPSFTPPIAPLTLGASGNSRTKLTA
jgi:hypothetical protein